MNEIRGREFGALPGLLSEGLLSDVTIQLPGRRQLQAHRALLASASDVLKAKFTGACFDSVEKVWRPDVGSAEAWQWIVCWIYGSREPLPWELFVEILILADCFQVTDLLGAIEKLELGGERAEALIGQLVTAFACPAALDKVAARVVPAVPPGRLTELLDSLQQAPLENVALLLKHLPLTLEGTLGGYEAFEEEHAFEEERLRLLGTILRARGLRESFPDCFVDIVRWELFPAKALEAARRGSFKDFEAAFGGPMPAPRIDMAKVLAARCQRLEAAHKAAQLPLDVSMGLFAHMLGKSMNVEVSCSSVLDGSASKFAILKAEKKNFATTDRQPSWIELRSLDMLVHVRAVGLQHGGNNEQHQNRCQSFVVEAALGERPWEELLRYSDRPLSDQNEVFPVDLGEHERGRPCRLFDRFRIRMTGVNTTNLWHLCVSWFDVFGSLRPRAAAELAAALSQSPGGAQAAEGEAKRRRAA